MLNLIHITKTDAIFSSAPRSYIHVLISVMSCCYQPFSYSFTVIRLETDCFLQLKYGYHYYCDFSQISHKHMHKPLLLLPDSLIYQEVTFL